MTVLPSSLQAVLESLKELSSTELNEILLQISGMSSQCVQCDCHYWNRDQCECLEDVPYCCQCWDAFLRETNEGLNVGYEACDCEPCSRLLSPKKRKVARVKDDE